MKISVRSKQSKDNITNDSWEAIEMSDIVPFLNKCEISIYIKNKPSNLDKIILSEENLNFGV